MNGLIVSAKSISLCLISVPSLVKDAIAMVEKLFIVGTSK